MARKLSMDGLALLALIAVFESLYTLALLLTSTKALNGGHGHVPGAT